MDQFVFQAACLLLKDPSLMTNNAEFADAIFSSLDVDNDGYVTKGEFIRGCTENTTLLKLLTPKPKQAKIP